MPTYDYQCKDCSHEFEAFQSMSAEVLKECPECGKESLQRLIGTGAGLVFKGSGFYETDYKKAPTESSSKDSGSTADSGNKSEKSSTTSESTKSSEKTTTTSTKAE